MNRRTTALISALLAAILFLAACGDSDTDDSAGTSSPSTAADDATTHDDTAGDDMTEDAMTEDAMEEDGMEEDAMEMGASPTDQPASTLRAGLTSLLQEHLYLAAITLETALDAGGDLQDPAVMAAASALDENSVALADAVASVAGDDNGEAFLGLWREHIGFFVEYTLGRATGDDARVDEARSDLEGYKAASSAFFEEITGGVVTADQVAAVLAPHTVTTFAAIDALVAGETTTFTLVREAGQVMPDIAAALAAAIAAAVPDQFPDDPNGSPAATRAVLTHLLQEHVYLAGIALEQAVEYGGDLENPAVVAAVAALDENSIALADVVGSVAGSENGEAFLGLWREHIGFFVEYTLGRATGDDARAEEARTALDGYKLAAGDFFEEITAGELTAEGLIPSLEEHTETVFATIDALTSGSPEVFAKLRVAAQHMPHAAAALAAGIVAATS